MSATADTVTAGSGRLRRFILHYLVSVMVTLEVLFVLHGLVGWNFDRELMKWLVPGVLPVSMSLLLMLIEGRGKPSEEPAGWVHWALTGLLLFGVWAGAYFLVGRYTDPARVRFLPSTFETMLPLRPSFSLLYVLLYPIFLLPFFAIRDRVAMQRLTAAYLLMFAVCSATFLAVPIAFDRPLLPTGPYDFGTWVLSLVYGSDPPWNCLPSEHCAAAMIGALATYEADRRIGSWAIFTALLIGVSTLYTKQHYLVDVVAGYGLAFLLHWGLRWSRAFEGNWTGAAANALDRLLK